MKRVWFSYLLPIVFLATSVWTADARSQAVRTETIAMGLQNPWGLAFLPDGRFLVSERPGRLRVVGADGALGAPVSGLPNIAAGGQGGLLDVVVDSDFARNRTLYFCFSEPASAGNANSTALARATLSTDSARLENLKIIFSQKPQDFQLSPFWLPHRRKPYAWRKWRARRQAVSDAGRTLFAQGRCAETRQPPRKNCPHQ